MSEAIIAGVQGPVAPGSSGVNGAISYLSLCEDQNWPLVSGYFL